MPGHDVFEWLLKILGVAAAITFGVYAPLSYNLTAAGNQDNDATQQNITQLLNRINEQVSAATELHSAAAVVLADLEDQLASVGVLRAWEFCDSRKETIGACATFNTTAKIDDVVSRLLNPTPAWRPNITATVTSTAAPTSLSPTTTLTSATVPTSSKPASDDEGVPTDEGPSQKARNVFGWLALVASLCAMLTLCWIKDGHGRRGSPGYMSANSY